MGVTNFSQFNMEIFLMFFLTFYLHFASCQVGFETWISDSLTEVEDFEISWVESRPVPSWLSGTYIKNGPAKSDFGGEKQYANVADGWAKINKFNIRNTGVQMTSKFLKTPTYQKCDEAHEIIPHITLGPVIPDDWTLGDLNEISSNVADNTIVTTTKMGEEFIASTDLPIVNIFNITTLNHIQVYDPKLHSTQSCAHWRKEPGTNNILNFHVKGTPGVWETLHLYRYPDGDLHHPVEIGSFHLTHSTMIHMFGVSENYAIFFIYPVSIDMVCGMEHLLHNLLACLKWKGDDISTDIIVMNLHTGDVTSHTKTAGLYATHHINAYEIVENGVEHLVVDLVRSPWYAMTNFTDRETMLNYEDTGIMTNLFNITRYTIDLRNPSVTAVKESSWPNELGIPYINQFDFPLINPEYEGKHYCFAYGQAIVETYRQYLVKKNICESSQDKVWYEENHYTAEPIFIPRPGAEEEDDGVVLVVVMNGFTEESYLLMLDGKTFEKIAVALLPEIVPMSIHGTWVPEIV